MKNEQISVFAVDCGATNWRLFRSVYEINHGKAKIINEPQCSPLTSFTSRQLPAAVFYDKEEKRVIGFGETALNHLEEETTRKRVRFFFKPSIGNHLIDNPQPHQMNYSHKEAMLYTLEILKKLIQQIQKEKWRSSQFNKNIRFIFSYPVHWEFDHNGEIFRDFREVVLNAFPKKDRELIGFVTEPEGAVLALSRTGLLKEIGDKKITLLVDVGGSTTDIIAGKINNESGGLDFLGRYGEPFGGGVFDFQIANYIADQLMIPSTALTEDPSILISLSLQSRRLKEALSKQLLQLVDSEAAAHRTCTIILENGEVYRKVIHLEKSNFDEITENLQLQFKDLIENALQHMQIAEESLGQVVLVGGGSKLFCIVQHLRERFGKEKVLLADNPDELVSQGIGYQFGREFDDIAPSIIFSIEDEDCAAQSENSEPQFYLQIKGKEKYPLRNSKNTIGRSISNDIPLNDQKSSRFHAEISVNGDEVFILDFESTNGTYINGKRIKPKETYIVAIKDEIRIGDSILTVDQME
jgi:molecular chaperone DnaK (HSP70)